MAPDSGPRTGHLRLRRWYPGDSQRKGCGTGVTEHLPGGLLKLGLLGDVQRVLSRLRDLAIAVQHRHRGDVYGTPAVHMADMNIPPNLLHLDECVSQEEETWGKEASAKVLKAV